MTVVTAAQIFQIVNGIDDYIKVNISLAQCIRDSLSQVQDLSSSAPYTSNMCFSDSSTEVSSSSLSTFTGNMITATNTFLDACATALQANKATKSDAAPSFTFLTTTFHTAQGEFLQEFHNYLVAFSLTLDQVEQPNWIATTGKVVVSDTIRTTTLYLVTKSDAHDFNVGVASNNALRRYKRMIEHLSGCYTTVGIMVSVIKGKYSSNSNFSGTSIATLASTLTTLTTYVNTLSNEGNDWLNSYNDWYPEAREGATVINYQQATMLATLNNWRDDFSSTGEDIVTAITIDAGGSGNEVGDILTLSDDAAGSVDAVLVVTGVSSGAVTSVEIINPGSGHTGTLTVTSSDTNATEPTLTRTTGDKSSLLGYINSMNNALNA